MAYFYIRDFLKGQLYILFYLLPFRVQLQGNQMCIFAQTRRRDYFHAAIKKGVKRKP